MKASEIVSQLTQHNKGAHVRVVWQRQAKTLKGFAGIIAKRTVAYVRTGLNYANLGAVKSGIESGTRGEVESLPWGQWRKGAENYIIDHKDTEYVRLYPATFANLKSESEWSINGKPATFAEVEPHLLASEKPKADDETPLCFTVKAESIVSIG